jgi:hypothetical protein
MYFVTILPNNKFRRSNESWRVLDSQIYKEG